MIERALITSPDGQIRIEAIVPLAAAPPKPGGVLTVDALRDLERDNILRALEAAGGRVGGEGGAASLLGTKPSTLRSRMAALGIERP